MKGDLKYATRFQDLVVWQKSRECARLIFEVTKRFPREEAFALTDQIRRSSRAVGAQVAEAWGKRSYPRHFALKLTDADAEQQETQHWLITAHDCGYLTRQETESLGAMCKEIGAMLGCMLADPERFCGSQTRLREDPPALFPPEIPPSTASEASLQ